MKSSNRDKEELKREEGAPEQEHLVVTLGRQFGCGGREIGKAIARRLGIAYYDKELLSLAADGAGVSEEYVERKDERTPRLSPTAMSFAMGFNPVIWYRTPTTISGDSIYETQAEIIRRLVSEGPCVIVGRTADYILREHKKVVRLFVHAPEDKCVRRIMERGDATTDRAAKQLHDRTNKLRASYYNFYTDKRWGDSRSYDLTVDSSVLGIEDIAELVANYVALRFKE